MFTNKDVAKAIRRASYHAKKADFDSAHFAEFTELKRTAPSAVSRNRGDILVAFLLGISRRRGASHDVVVWGTCKKEDDDEDWVVVLFLGTSRTSRFEEVQMAAVPHALTFPRLHRSSADDRLSQALAMSVAAAAGEADRRVPAHIETELAELRQQLNAKTREVFDLKMLIENQESLITTAHNNLLARGILGPVTVAPSAPPEQDLTLEELDSLLCDGSVTAKRAPHQISSFAEAFKWLEGGQHPRSPTGALKSLSSNAPARKRERTHELPTRAELAGCPRESF